MKEFAPIHRGENWGLLARTQEKQRQSEKENYARVPFSPLHIILLIQILHKVESIFQMTRKSEEILMIKEERINSAKIETHTPPLKP